jgi:hypothetical protein
VARRANGKQLLAALDVAGRGGGHGPGCDNCGDRQRNGFERGSTEVLAHPIASGKLTIKAV